MGSYWKQALLKRASPNTAGTQSPAESPVSEDVEPSPAVDAVPELSSTDAPVEASDVVAASVVVVVVVEVSGLPVEVSPVEGPGSTSAGS